MGNDFAQVDFNSNATLKVHSKKNLESIAILTSNGEHVTKAIIRIPEEGKVGFDIEDRFRLPELIGGLIRFDLLNVDLKPDQEVVFISKSRDGNVYRQRLLLKYGHTEDVMPVSIYTDL